MQVRRPLLPSVWRPVAVLVWVAATVVLIVLSMHFAHVSGGNRVDAAVDSRVRARLAEHARLLSVAVRLGSPEVVVGGSVLLALMCGAGRWLRGAVFALGGAPLAGGVTELVLKPAIDRTTVTSSALQFPSGHTTGAFALALTAVVLLLPTAQTRLLPALGRLLLAMAALAVAAVVAVGVVVLGWHYTTDAVGGAATALAVVLALAAVIDTTAWVASAERDGGPPSQAAVARQ